MDKIPVTILTGALGAGKTTLIKNILGQLPGRRVLLVENEFAAVNIDADILADSQHSLDIIELSNGCVCCNIRGDLVASLLAALNEGHLYERVIIECTGVADPGQIATAFAPMSVLSGKFVIDATLCVIDAVNHFRSREDQKIYEKQIAFSDRMILSKTDLVDREQKINVLNSLREMHPTGVFFEALNGEIALKDILDIYCYSFKNFNHELRLPSGFISRQAMTRPFEHHLKSIIFKIKGKFDRSKFEVFLSIFYLTHADQVIRSKGILYFSDVAHKIYFHAVYDQFSFGAADSKTPETPENENVLIFIGSEIKEEYLEKGLYQCLS